MRKEFSNKLFHVTIQTGRIWDGCSFLLSMLVDDLLPCSVAWTRSLVPNKYNTAEVVKCHFQASVIKGVWPLCWLLSPGESLGLLGLREASCRTVSSPTERPTWPSVHLSSSARWELNSAKPPIRCFSPSWAFR